MADPAYHRDGQSVRNGGELEIMRLKRAMTALTRATEALIRAHDEQHLLDQVCKVAVDVAGYRLAWVGYAMEGDGHPVVPMAISGNAEDYVRQANISWGEDNPRGRGPTGTSIRTGTTQILRCTATEDRFTPWREAAQRHGFQSTVSLPLKVHGSTIGSLCIYAGDMDAFDADELWLLEDLANNLSYGIASQRLRVEREQAERELKASEERYRVLVESAPDAIIVHDMSSKILFANAAAETMFRSPPGETLIGRLFLDLCHGEDRGLVERRIREDIVPAGVHELQLQRRDGQPFPTEVVVARTTFRGQPARHAVIRDVTESKGVQAQLVQTAKLASLGEMAAGIAHELSQPINIVRMAADAALMFLDRGKATPEYLKQQFGSITGQAGRMAEIIDHIRIFSRSDTGPAGVFDAMAAVRAAVEMVQRPIEAGGVSLHVDLPRLEWPVSGRPVQLEQVVLNLLTNAQDAVNDRARRAGKPEGWQPLIRIISEQSAETLTITVCDSGGGISEENLARIFEPFFTTKETGRGTGLGLSISFGIVASMGGRLSATNGPDGACFQLSLPRCLDQAATTPLPASIHVPQGMGGGGQQHILVVDDEPGAVEAMADFLRETGFRVSTAVNGNAAWELFQQDPADLVVTDIRMPGGDGEELLLRLRDWDLLLPIIIVTGHVGATEALGDVDDDCLKILKKPLSLAELLKSIEALLHPVPAEI